jgi:hypothetical protein
MKRITQCKLAILTLLAGVAQVALAHPYGHHETGDVMLRAHTHATQPGSWVVALGFLAAGIGLQLASHKLRALHAHRWLARLAAGCLAAGGAALLMV